MSRSRYYIPRGTIDWIVGGVHVSAADAQVYQAVYEHPLCSGMTPGHARRCAEYAVRSHRRNQTVYSAVMGGRI